MENSPTISVVLPSYNHGRLIARAMHMLLAQDSGLLEIIVVEDGSSDNSLEIIRKLAGTSPEVPIKILVNKINRGAINALGQGLEAAQGDYVYFAAADDWVLPGFFTAAIKALEANSQMGLFCGEALLVRGDSAIPAGIRPSVRPAFRPGPISPARVRKLLASSDNWILTGSAVFRREAVIAAGGFNTKLGSFSDGYLSRRIALTRGFFFAPTLVSTWCIYSGNVSRRSVFNPDIAMDILKSVPAKLTSDEVFPSWYPALFERRWRFSTARLALVENPPLLSLVIAMAGISALDRRVIAMIVHLPGDRLTRFFTTTWLWFRFRPLTLRGFLRTLLTRRLETHNRRLQAVALDTAQKPTP